MKPHCSLGVGCDESGHCYASAHGHPERCGMGGGVDLESLEFDAEREQIRLSVLRLQEMEKRPGDAARMVREAFETVGAALGNRPLSVRMLQHAACVRPPR
jgi:hypothetical protein